MFTREFSIGPHRIAPATVLAPMVGVADAVFRRMIRNQGGCGLIMTEFTSSHGIVGTSKAANNNAKPTRTFRYLYFNPEEHPILAQLFGADPAVMADAARFCEPVCIDTQKKRVEQPD
jgi:tRNA-dihydrouridine synthase